jgi:lipid A 4'-phosphatase
MKRRHQEGLLGLLGMLLCGSVFALWPGLDTQVSAWFYDASLPGFPAKRLDWVTHLYLLAPLVNQILFVGSLLVLLAAWLKPALVNPRWRQRSTSWALMMVLGIGVVVDWALKDHVGRARPEHSQAFGGSLVSRPLFEFDQACDLNCSFVSGHAAGGFALMAWGLWAPRRKRQQWLVLGVLTGLGIGAVRIAQGGHFLSDVIFAGWVIWLVFQSIRHSWLHWRLRKLRRRRLLSQQQMESTWNY